MTLADQYRRMLQVYVRIARPTKLQTAAFQFVFEYLDTSLEYGRPTFSDFRIQSARSAYNAVRALGRWARAA